MTQVIYSGMIARCKDCLHLRRIYEGKRVIHKCARGGDDRLTKDHPTASSVTLQAAACKQFKHF